MGIPVVVVDIKSASREMVSSIFYDYSCKMAYSFNGTPYPDDFPRNNTGKRVALDGKQLAYSELKRYCASNNIKHEDSENK